MRHAVLDRHAAMRRHANRLLEAENALEHEHRRAEPQTDSAPTGYDVHKSIIASAPTYLRNITASSKFFATA